VLNCALWAAVTLDKVHGKGAMNEGLEHLKKRPKFCSWPGLTHSVWNTANRGYSPASASSERSVVNKDFGTRTRTRTRT